MAAPSLFRKLLYFGVLAIATLLLGELITSVFYYHQYGKRKLALVELYHNFTGNRKAQQEAAEKKAENYRNQQLLRPDSSREMTRQVYDETIAANNFIYEPWVEFRNADFKGKYVNTTGFERRTVPSLTGKGKDTITVWFFGGSTMFGFNVADEETIPSWFVRLYADIDTTTTCLQVVNFGVPYYFSYQEYQLFRLLLEQRPPPDMAIFMDGLNDFWSYSNTYYLQPYFSTRLSSMMQQNVMEFLPSDPGNLPRLRTKNLSPAQCDTLLMRYLSTCNRIETTANAMGIRTLFVVQPVPFYQYPNQMKDPVCSKDSYPAFHQIYPRLKASFAGQSNRLYLGNMLAQTTGLPFIDKIHYAPQFNKQIAFVLLQQLLQ